MKRAFAAKTAAAAAAAWMGFAAGHAALAQSYPATVEAPTELERNNVRQWSRDNINEAPFTYEGFESDRTLYWMAAGGPGKRLWLRDEYFDPSKINGKLYRSSKALYEVDCAGKKWRSLSADLFAGNSMQGTPDHVDTPDAAWATPASGSNAEDVLLTACKAP